MSKKKSLKDCSLKVFSKCICHCLCICLRRCLFVGQVMFSYDPNQFCRVSDWSGRPEGFESTTMSESMTKVGLELLGQLKMPQTGFPFFPLSPFLATYNMPEALNNLPCKTFNDNLLVFPNANIIAQILQI